MRHDFNESDYHYRLNLERVALAIALGILLLIGASDVLGRLL